MHGQNIYKSIEEKGNLKYSLIYVPEGNEPNIIPNIVYTVCERNFSRHILINFVNVTIPAIIPNPNIINTGIAEKSSDIKAFTFSIIGMYKPNINNNVDPDIPGNIIADIAIIAAINI